MSTLGPCLAFGRRGIKAIRPRQTFPGMSAVRAGDLPVECRWSPGGTHQT